MKNEIVKQRLANQQINVSEANSPTELVAWMGAMQAQDYDMSKWAIGVRLPNQTEGIVEAALNNGEVLRTHVLRPTWHLVSPTHIRWMLALSRPQIEKIVAGYNERLGLDYSIRHKSNQIIEKALEEQPNLTRNELMQALENQGIIASDIRAAHLMFHAELTGLVCSGIRKGKQLTYALLDERAPMTKPLLRDEALAKLAKLYFQSHSPATLKDFSWWSGLSQTDARKGIDHIKDQLETLQVDKTVYYVFPSKNMKTIQKDILLLPAFDEYMVSYTDRSAALDPRFAKQAISSNGIFTPIIVHHGQVIGIWKRKMKPKYVEIELLPFEPMSKNLSDNIKEHFAAYQDYLSGLEMRFL
jgi:Winged helix DNA-binding domain